MQRETTGGTHDTERSVETQDASWNSCSSLYEQVDWYGDF